MVSQQMTGIGGGGRMPMPADGDIAPVVAHLDQVEEVRPGGVDDHLWEQLVSLLRRAVEENQEVDELRRGIAELGDEAVELLQVMAERIHRV